MRVLRTADLPSLLPRLLEFEARSFGDYPYTPAPERLMHWWEQRAFFVAAVEDEKSGRLDSLLSVVATSAAEIEKFVSGQIPSSKQMAPHPLDGSPVALYMPTLIVGNLYWTPVLFKNLLQELNAGLQASNSSAESITATASDKRAIFLMRRFGFEPLGAYKDGYQIMRATRQSCGLLKNLVY